MANETNNQRGINRSWTLCAFVAEFGTPRFVNDFQGTDGNTFCGLSFPAAKFPSNMVREFIDKVTGMVRKSSFVTVSLSANCPARTKEQIYAQRENLQVVELAQDAEHQYVSFKLCKNTPLESRGELMDYDW